VSKDDLPLTMPVRVNMLCDHLANLAQNNCHKGVITVFKTDFDDEFEIISNPNALEKLLTLLLSDATRYTQKGFINLQCADAGELVRFSVTDTGTSHDPGTRSENVLDDDGVSYVNMNFNVCQSICRLLHGHIWYDQEYADGTRFYFELPKRPSIIYREAN
jgi:signal transduction histidine kinase